MNVYQPAPHPDVATNAICPCCGYDLIKEAPVEFGDLRFTPVLGVTYRGVRLKMPRQCHEILGTLMRSSHRPISKSALNDRMGWEDSQGNVLEVRISLTRATLRMAGLPDLIVTIQHVGYWFDASLLASPPTTQENLHV